MSKLVLSSKQKKPPIFRVSFSIEEYIDDQFLNTFSTSEMCIGIEKLYHLVDKIYTRSKLSYEGLR